MEMAAAARLILRGRTKERDTAGGDETTKIVVAAKRRKLEVEEDGESRIRSSPRVHMMSRGGISAEDLAEAQENILIGRTSSVQDQCGSPSSEDNLSEASISCCSCNGFVKKVNRRIDFLDLEKDNGAEIGTSRHYSCNTRNETSAYREHGEESDSMNSAAAKVQAPEAAVPCRLSMETKSCRTVTEAEVEDFFMAAEKDLRKNTLECSRKYNFDFTKEEPLEGVYEWVRLKP